MIQVLSSDRLTLSPRIEQRLQQGELTQAQVDEFRAFLYQVDQIFLQHRISRSRTGQPLDSGRS